MKRRIAIVQPVLAPYAKQRFEELAKDDDFDIHIFVEKQSFCHRPDWTIQHVQGCKVDIIDSIIINEDVENIDFGYRIAGLRAIPYKLPILIGKYRPDAVLVCNATELSFCYFVKHLLKCKLGIMVEDTLHAVQHKDRVLQYVKSALYRKADFFIPLSDDAEYYLKRIGIATNIHRSSWSIDLDYFSRKFDIERCRFLRTELGLGNKTTFLTVGQLIPRKGIINLLEAWKELPLKVQTELALIIIGEGLQKNQINSFINGNRIPNVFLLGHRAYEEMVNYYHMSDVFILPTLEDLFSLTVMEAMASGLPVLTTKYNGARELVRNGINGYVFDPANIDEIKKTIIHVFHERDCLAQNGRMSLEIIQNYSHDRVIPELGKALHAILST